MEELTQEQKEMLEMLALLGEYEKQVGSHLGIFDREDLYTDEWKTYSREERKAILKEATEKLVLICDTDAYKR